MTHTEYLKKVGIELKVARIRKEMSIADIVKASGLSKDAISNMENGKNDAHILTYKRVADALGVEMKDIL